MNWDKCRLYGNMCISSLLNHHITDHIRVFKSYLFPLSIHCSKESDNEANMMQI